MAEATFIESLLHGGSQRFDEVLNDKFNQHAHFSHLDPVYIVNFLLGLSSMLMSNDIRSKYGIERIFFTNFGSENIARLIILTSQKSIDGTSTVRSMKVRTFDMSNYKSKANRVLLSSEENNVMKLLLSGHVDGLSKEFANTVKNLYKTLPNLEKIDLDQYPADYALYSVSKEEMYKTNGEDIQSRMKIHFLESLSNEQLRKHFSKYHVADISYLLSPLESTDFQNTENSMLLITHQMIISPKFHWIFDCNSIPNMFRQYYEYTGLGATSLAKFREVVTGQNGLSGLFRRIAYSKGPSAECGFAHGALFFLSLSFPVYIEVRQKISTAAFSTGTDPLREMSIVCRPESEGHDHLLFQIPLVVYFPKTQTNPNKAVEEAPKAMSLMGRVGAMAVKFREGYVQSSFGTIMKRDDLIDRLFYIIRKNFNPPDLIATLIENEMTKIRPQSSEYKLTERNYVSRYIVGWLASSSNIQSTCYQLLSAHGDNDNTKFLIKSTNEGHDKSAPTNIVLDIREGKMTKTHIPETYFLDEPYIQYVRKNNEDTVILTIEQEYVHSQRDILSADYDRDFTRFTVSVSFANVKDAVQSYDVVELLKIPVKNILDNLADRKSLPAEKQLSALFTSAAHMLGSVNDFRAFIDGMFLNNACIRSAAEDKSAHADVYFIFNSGQGRISRINFKALFDHSIKDKIEHISRSAYDGIKLSRWLHQDRLFQFIFDKSAETLKVRLLDKEQLIDCANTRVRRVSSKSCSLEVSEDETVMEHENSRELAAPKVFNSWKKVATIANYMIYGFMVRDVISEAVHEQYGAMTRDLGFLLASASSPILGQVAEFSGGTLLKSGSKFSAYALKTIGFGLQKAISFYVLTDLVQNTLAYVHNTNDSGAKIGMAVDSAFLAIDVLTMAAQSFGVMALMGPIGELTGALLVVGLNVYQAVKRVQMIESVLPLTTGEMVDESLRAFFHMDMEKYVQGLITEKAANQKLLEEAIDYLNQQSRIDTLITESVDFSNKTQRFHSDNIIDMRSSISQIISRASPAIANSSNLCCMQMACYLHQEKIEIAHSPGFWGKFFGFFTNVFKYIRLIDQLLEDKYSNESHVMEDNLIRKNTSTCHNSFGVSKEIKSLDNYALFRLGNGSDHVYGYPDKPNIFQIAEGVKNITGGNRNDLFILTRQPITCILDGSDGIDVLDLSSLNISQLRMSENIVNIAMKSTQYFLLVNNFETIILPYSTQKPTKIFVDHKIQRIISNGKKTTISIPSNHNATSLVLQLSRRTKVKNRAIRGDFIYIMKHDKLNKTVLNMIGDSTANHKIVFEDNLWDVQNLTNCNRTFRYETIDGCKFKLKMSSTIIKRTQLMFKDGSVINLSDNLTTSATLSTNLTVRDIESIYSDVLERLKILMVAYSFSDNESITISHSEIKSSKSMIKGHVLHNSVDHSTSMILDDRRYLVLICPNWHSRIEKTTIKSRNVGNSTEVVIDLNRVIARYQDRCSFIGVAAYLQNGSDLNIRVILQKNGTQIELGCIFIQGIMNKNFYDKITIRNYGEMKIRLPDCVESSSCSINETDSNLLVPSDLNFGNSTDVIALTPYNVEPNNRIIIDLNVFQYDYFKINETILILTNIHYSLFYNQDSITIFLESFYTVEKMKTLRIIIAGKLIDFEKDMIEILAAPDFSVLQEELDLLGWTTNLI